MKQIATQLSVGTRLRLVATAAALLSILAIGWLDYLTGPEFGFALFYLVPVVTAGVWLGRAPATLCAILASATWLAADIALVSPGQTWISVWNGLTRLVIFVFVGVVTALMRRDHLRLQQLLAHSETVARTDAVTGLPNARAFLEGVAAELARAHRERHPICLLYIDLDDFKKVNDLFGHAAGNELLERIGSALHDSVRAGDLPARIGGDEFAVLLWNADPKTATRIAQRIIDRITAMRADYPKTTLGASAGVACFASPPDDTAEAVRTADQAMYEAKRRGKGCVVVRADDWSEAT